jgi:hypothetical protein
MPLRDHFHTDDSLMNWEALHGGWPMMIVQQLNANLPEDYVAQPRVHLGSMMEIDVAAFEHAEAEWSPESNGNGGVATAAWAPSAPAILLDTELPTPSEYEVLIYDIRSSYRLVAAIELVSPSNKDRAENRQTFVNKCETMLKKDVCVAIVDPVTSRSANLYGELQAMLAAPRTAVSRAGIYAVSCRGRRAGPRWRLEAWEHDLAIGQPLPKLPLWLNESFYVPLDLEASYEASCRSLRIR